jgi:PAS domain S-box-containing protein
MNILNYLYILVFIALLTIGILTFNYIRRKKLFLNYDDLINCIGDGIVLTNEKGFIIKINPVMSEILGYDENEILGKRIFDFVHEDFMLIANEKFKKVISGNVNLNGFEIKIRKKDNMPRWLFIRAIVSKNKKKVLGIKSIVTDITEIKNNKIVSDFQRLISKKLNSISNIDVLYKFVLGNFMNLDGIDAGIIFEGDNKILELSYKENISKELEVFIDDIKSDFFNIGEKQYFYFEHLIKVLGLENDRKKLFEILVLVPIVFINKIIGYIALFSFSKSKLSVEVIESIEITVPQISDVIIRIRKDSEVKDEKANLEKIIHSIPFGIVILSKRGYIKRMNKAATDLVGIVNESEALERKCINVYCGRTIENCCIVKNKVNSGKFEDFIIDKERNKIPVLKSIVEVNLSSEFVIVETFVDIRKEKKVLADLEEAMNTAKLADRAKSAFLSNISHEIRTPINAIIGYSELLGNYKNDEKSSNYIDSIESGGKTLLSIINDILDISKMETGKILINKTSVKMIDLMSEFKKIFQLQLIEKNIYMKFHFKEKFPEFVIINRVHVRQILLNLIGNAVKFTFTGGIDIFVDYKTYRENIINISITIKDSGIGIEKEYLDDLYKIFSQQSDKISKKYSGMGLGLAISKRLTEAMNGELFVKSQVNDGSEFILSLYKIKSYSEKSNNFQSIKPINNFEIVNYKKDGTLNIEELKINKEEKLILKEEYENNFSEILKVLKFAFRQEQVTDLSEKLIETAQKVKWDTMIRLGTKLDEHAKNYEIVETKKVIDNIIKKFEEI